MNGRWAPDPWHVDDLRWHDGSTWTEHVTSYAPPPPPTTWVVPATPPPVPAAPPTTWIVPTAQPAVTPTSQARSGRRNEPGRAATRRRVGAIAAAGVVGLGVVGFAFGSGGGEGAETGIVATTKTAAPASTAAVAATGQAAPATDPVAAVADPAMVDMCVEFTQLAAFIGMAEYQSSWDAAGHDVEVLRSTCASFTQERLDQMAAEQADVEAFLAAAEASEVASAGPLPSAAPEEVAVLPIASLPADTTAAPVVTQAQPQATLPPLPAPPVSVTAAPPVPSVQPVVVTAPPTVATVAPSPACDPNYSGACVPIASDVDCAGGSGNGPAYVVGPVTVIGRDIYGLDGNGDGIGC